MNVPEWMKTPADLIGKTIAAIEPCLSYHWLPDSPFDSHPNGFDANAWKVTFTDGSVRFIEADNDDSCVVICESQQSD